MDKRLYNGVGELRGSFFRRPWRPLDLVCLRVTISVQKKVALSSTGQGHFRKVDAEDRRRSLSEVHLDGFDFGIGDGTHLEVSGAGFLEREVVLRLVLTSEEDGEAAKDTDGDVFAGELTFDLACGVLVAFLAQLNLVLGPDPDGVFVVLVRGGADVSAVDFQFCPCGVTVDGGLRCATCPDESGEANQQQGVTFHSKPHVLWFVKKITVNRQIGRAHV